MAKTKKIKLSHQEGKGFKKSVGKHVGRGGELKPKTFWLGEYEEPARKLAQFIVDEWKGQKAKGIDRWTDDAIQRIETFKAGKMEEGAERQPTPSTKVSGKGEKTTHQAIDLFRDDFLTSKVRANGRFAQHWPH